MASERDKLDKVLDLTKDQIERKFGKGSLMKLGEHAEAAQIPAIPTGSLALDAALGVGGVPRGRVNHGQIARPPGTHQMNGLAIETQR